MYFAGLLNLIIIGSWGGPKWSFALLKGVDPPYVLLGVNVWEFF